MCGGDKHLMKTTMNIVVFPFTIRKEKVRISKTSESLKYFALITYFTALHIYIHFTFTSIILCMTLWACLRYVISRTYYFTLTVYFTILDYMFPKRLVRTILFCLINKFKNISCTFDFDILCFLDVWKIIFQFTLST